MTNRSMNDISKVAVVVTAAGSSSRMGGSLKKEYLTLGNGTVLSACVKAFEAASKDTKQPFIISHMIITVPQNDSGEASKAVLPYNVEFVPGGSTRQKSVLNALEYINKSTAKPDYVLIHDGARPFVTVELISNVLQAVCQFNAAAPGIVPTDTIKQIDRDGFIVSHLVRSSLTAIQTPQGFAFEKLLEAHRKAAADGHDYTDDSEIWDKYSGRVKLVAGDTKNIKITYPGDLERGAAL